MTSQLNKSHIVLPESYPAKYGSLIISFDNLSLEIYKFFKKPRKNIIGASVEYSFAGNPLIKRNYGESKHQWDVSCLLDVDGFDRFMGIASLHDNYINENFSESPENYSLIIDDYLNPVIERGPNPKREFANEATDIKIINEGSAIRYFARFYAALNLESIASDRKGPWWQLDFTMHETILFLPS